MERIEKVAEGIIKIPAEEWLAGVYSQMNGYEFLVEPLSAKKTFLEFVREGGIGYHSLHEGTFGAGIFKVIFENYSYGLDYTSLYNAGYPLHRILEHYPNSLCDVDLGSVQAFIVKVRKKQVPRVTFTAGDLSTFAVPPLATNVIFVNPFGAKLFGIGEQSGTLSTYDPKFGGETEEKLKSVWNNRFVEDALPAGQRTFKVLTMKSNVTKIYELYASRCSGLFFASFTNKGVMVVISEGDAPGRDLLKEILALKMTYRMGG